jgi:hypothetical protein
MATRFSGGRSRITRRESLAAANRVHLLCNLQSRARTHAVLVMGLYELLGNPTTSLIEPPGPSAKRKRTKGQTMIHKTLHRKLKIKKNETH